MSLIKFIRNLIYKKKKLVTKESKEEIIKVEEKEQRQELKPIIKRDIFYVNGKMRKWKEGLKCEICGGIIERETAIISNSTEAKRLYCSESCWDESFEIAMRMTTAIFGGHNADVPIGMKRR
ncbi:MAG: hypothetical protein KJ888_20700 [Gammaproteobacteria bacterium]|uniref:Uncharacterized protein n=1 Tax=viral metagenome TaxID=1070528 RepID=A0A6M3LN72_9ZZZZ|nr:hypothetical protein [Gammaproteobacteria bacterium]